MTKREARHGTVSRYGNNHKCRCEDCREANRIAQLNYIHSHPEQQSKKRQRETERRVRVGKVVSERLQPCPECGELMMTFSTHMSRVHGMEPPHGTASKYRHGCRCDECRRASADYRQMFRLRKKEREAHDAR